MNIRIERAGVRHAIDIANVGRHSFHHAFAHLFEQQQVLDQYLDQQYSPRKIAGSIANPNNILFAAYVDGAPAGFSKMRKHSLNTHIPAELQSELQKIYVLPAFHGTGVGAQLLEAILWETQLLRSGVLWLDVHVSNAKAKRFYEKNSFERVGEHQFLIGPQTFEYDVMARSIG